MLTVSPETNLEGYPSHAHFETPENVLIGYPLAGGGTRFLAWLVDQVVVWLGTITISITLLVLGIAVGLLESGAGGFSVPGPDDDPQFLLYFVGLMLLVINFGSFAYFFVSESFFRGETLGKRLMELRVVKANGFSLDPLSLFLRNLFRFVDHIPPLWIVPVFSRRMQRAGDMVAGTLVVRDRVDPLPRIRRELSGRTELDARFRFDTRLLGRLRPVDIEFIERLLERWNSVSPVQRHRLLQQTLPSLALRVGTDVPPHKARLTYLMDLLAAEYRQRSRGIV